MPQWATEPMALVRLGFRFCLSAFGLGRRESTAVPFDYDMLYALGDRPALDKRSGEAG